MKRSEKTSETSSQVEDNLGFRGATGLRIGTMAAVPGAALIALGVHLAISHKQSVAETHCFSVCLGGIFVLGVAGAFAQPFWNYLRRWMGHMCPIIAAAIMALCVW